MEHGIITEDESKLLVQFREQIQDLDVPDDLLGDKNLVRWLRAREHRIKDAELMFRAHMKWRSENDIETLKDFRLPSKWDDYYQVSLYNITDDGYPIFVIKINTWDFERGVKAGMKDEIIRNGLALLERGWLTCIENSINRNYTSQFISLYDLSGLTWSHFNSSASLKVILEIVQGYEANYPEVLGVGFLLNAKTTSKLKFLGSNVNDWRTEISKVVPLNKIPQCLGGDGDDSAHMIPRL